MGAPLFAFFAKGGHDTSRSAGFDFVEKVTIQTALYLRLQRKAQGNPPSSQDSRASWPDGASRRPGQVVGERAGTDAAEGGVERSDSTHSAKSRAQLMLDLGHRVAYSEIVHVVRPCLGICGGLFPRQHVAHSHRLQPVVGML
jgi:hypothetical protein